VKKNRKYRLILVIYILFWYLFIVMMSGGLSRSIRKFVILLCTVSMLYGCAATWFAVGGIAALGGYKWVEGRLSRDYPFAYSKSWDIVNRALANLGISVSDSIDEGRKGRIEAVRRDGTKVTLILKDQGIGITNIIVVVGVFSDRESAEKIHDEILTVSRIK
jgi:hypothetical protein